MITAVTNKQQFIIVKVDHIGTTGGLSPFKGLQIFFF